jgi:hypothetical protein
MQEESLKVIVCAAILQLCPGYIWMGAGNPPPSPPPLQPPSHPRAGDIDLKLGCNVQEFISRTAAFVGDISDVVSS